MTATVVAELLFGVARLPDGARKSRLAETIRTLVDDDLGGRVIAFDRAAASHYAQIVANPDRIGRPMALADAQITVLAFTPASRPADRRCGSRMRGEPEALRRGTWGLNKARAE